MTIFGRAYAEAYDALYAAKDYAGECDMIEQLLAEFGTVRPIRRVLDLGCGTGGHAIPLATRGYDVTGIDVSPAMIARAREKTAAAGLTGAVVFDRGDIRGVRLGDAPFDGAIMMFAVLSYQQTLGDARAAISTARAHLVAGAAFIFDVWYGPGLLANKPGVRFRTVETPAGRIVRRVETELDEPRQLGTVTHRLDRWLDGKLAVSTSERHVMRFFLPQEFDRLARDCGFVCSAIRRLPDWRASADQTTWTAVGVFRAV